MEKKHNTQEMQVFVREYMVDDDFDAPQAYKKVFGEDDEKKAYALLQDPRALKILEKELEDQAAGEAVRVNKILHMMLCGANYDPMRAYYDDGKPRPMWAIDPDTRRAITGKTSKGDYTFVDRTKYIQMLGVFSNMFNAKGEGGVASPNGPPIRVFFGESGDSLQQPAIEIEHSEPIEVKPAKPKPDKKVSSLKGLIKKSSSNKKV